MRRTEQRREGSAVGKVVGFEGHEVKNRRENRIWEREVEKEQQVRWATVVISKYYS